MDNEEWEAAAETLKRSKNLLDLGLITQEDYDQIKKEIINEIQYSSPLSYPTPLPPDTIDDSSLNTTDLPDTTDEASDDSSPKPTFMEGFGPDNTFADDSRELIPYFLALILVIIVFHC